MSFQSPTNRRMATLFVAATLLHAALLLIPKKQHTPIAVESPLIAIKLKTPEVAEPSPASEPMQPERLPSTNLARDNAKPEPVVLTPLPVQPVIAAPIDAQPTTAEVSIEQPQPASPIVTVETSDPRKRRDQVLSSQFNLELSDPLFKTEYPDGKPDYQVYLRPGLQEVLNEPSLQLPFADKRIYLIDSYGSGISGDVERFFDTVTVPFGWTTKGNTRIQCVWILIISGCSWGHVSLFEKKARRRQPDDDR